MRKTPVARAEAVTLNEFDGPDPNAGLERESLRCNRYSPGLAIPPKVDAQHTLRLFMTTETNERVRS